MRSTWGALLVEIRLLRVDHAAPGTGSAPFTTILPVSMEIIIDLPIGFPINNIISLCLCPSYIAYVFPKAAIRLLVFDFKK